MPFDIYLESEMAFEVELAGMWYSFTKMKITLTRNNFDELQGSFYGPTLMLSLLSLVSYGISEDSVKIFFKLELSRRFFLWLTSPKMDVKSLP